MLTINGLKRFYFITDFSDMRCGHSRVSQMVRMRYGRDPYNGDVYVYMSKNRRTVRLIHYQDHAYYMHQKTFPKGREFVRLVRDAGKDPVWKIDWKDLVSVLECPVIREIRVGDAD